MTLDTIFALSSGPPPAGIGVMRISGPAAGATLQALAGVLPPARRATYRTLRNVSGEPLDQALILWLPGPGTATGEDIAELHLHGGRAIIAAVERELAAQPGLRSASPGEFTRRAFANGRIDLAEAEGLADLLTAETELQRQAAMAAAGGLLSAQVEGWRIRLLHLAASLEAVLDFGDEDDVALPPSFMVDLAALAHDIDTALAAPSADMLREGFRVALAGPPNAGKSTLFNALVEQEAAITAAIPGTTRDVLSRPVALAGIPFLLIDMAGLRDDSADPVEAIGIARAEAEIARADLVLWLGPEGRGPHGAWEIDAQSDRGERQKSSAAMQLSARTGERIDVLRERLVEHAQTHMPKPGQAVLNLRQRTLLQTAEQALADACHAADPLVQAELLRMARVSFDRMVGRSGTEDVLDALFGRFCIGK
ncbi:tRNA modification GTPase TrmE [Croceibacterium mercuriale]|uniref:tRNA modification GTPase MnmE n=1 Tax=Croceibacterium mercuriale TaxID=1572751 RepID=A0A0B2BU78_9SPHN|nr:tRNA uridine-5-carboxymethylaminomethyl(34) synthesis GTPase MnmE [Croceibacterium mercuriale]KHL25113.1 tRNA modification GTPase TrmE [Croceibacterium mercuriale]